MEGIRIDEHEAQKESIPEDLNSLAYAAYRIPDLKRRKLFGIILIFLSLLGLIMQYLFDWIDFGYAIFLTFALAIYVFFLKSDINIQQSHVIESIATFLDHELGYYSTALTFKGILLEPVWTVIVYDHNNPPKERTIIEIDANSGSLINEVYNEKI